MTPDQEESQPDTAGIRAGLEGVLARIGDAAKTDGRDASAVTLVAVSKAHPAAAAAAAIDAGHRTFGENRVQEAMIKWPALKERNADVRLHLIGGLQRNKVADAVRLFDVIETLDRPRLAEALAREMAETGLRPACFIQINTGEEPQKGGIRPADADAFIEDARGRLALPVTGLMCIPPVDDEAALHFALLREIAGRNGLENLSMGMSGDFETAIRFGATHVRVGTAVFGERPVRKDSRPD